VEFSGKSGNAVTRELTEHEAWQYCLDTLPMFLATVAFHLYHPGRVLQGPDSSFPSRKEKKRQKALAKAASESSPNFRFHWCGKSHLVLVTLSSGSETDIKQSDRVRNLSSRTSRFFEPTSEEMWKSGNQNCRFEASDCRCFGVGISRADMGNSVSDR
jgi:hypothetical protein